MNRLHPSEPQIDEDGWDPLPMDARGALGCGLVIGFLLGMGVVWASNAGEADATKFRTETKITAAQNAAILRLEKLLGNDK